MHDPHIDIDELDEAPTGNSTATNEFTDFSKGKARNPGPGELFMGMTHMLKQWQEQNLRLVPEETVKHLRASQREWLLAWRSLIDVALEKLERQELRDELRKEADISDDKSASPVSHKIIVEEFEG